MAPRAPHKTYHHGDLRNQLLQAALALIEEKGVAALSIREAAVRAGVSAAAPYRHFATKEALLATIASDGYEALADALEATLAEPSPRARFLATARAYMHFVRQHPAYWHVMESDALASVAEHPALLAACRRAEAVLAAVVGEDKPDVAVAAHAFVNGFAGLWLGGLLHGPGGGSEDPEAWVERLAGLLWDGIGRA